MTCRAAAVRSARTRQAVRFQKPGLKSDQRNDDATFCCRWNTNRGIGERSTDWTPTAQSRLPGIEVPVWRSGTLPTPVAIRHQPQQEHVVFRQHRLTSIMDVSRY